MKTSFHRMSIICYIRKISFKCKFIKLLPEIDIWLNVFKTVRQNDLKINEFISARTCYAL